MSEESEVGDTKACQRSPLSRGMKGQPQKKIHIWVRCANCHNENRISAARYAKVCQHCHKDLYEKEKTG